MTQKQLAAIVRGILPVVRAQVAEAVARVAPLQQQIAAQDAQIADLQRRAQDDAVTKELGTLRERVALVEVRPSAVNDSVVTDLRDQIKAFDGRLNAAGSEITALLVKTAVLETRAPVPGPPGQDGIHGKDGADGLGFDDVSVEHDGERSFTFKYTRGERVKTAGTFTVPLMIYRGVFAEGKTYEVGDVVSWAGSTWHCEKTTVLKPDAVGRDPVTGEAMGRQGKDFWTLIVKAGREGKQGRDGRDLLPLPVVAVGARK